MTENGLDRLPTFAELAAYRVFVRAQARVARCLERDLIAEQKLTLPAFDVLAALNDAPERRMRMTDLAEAVLLSRSGVTRLVDRLERFDYVHRVRVDSDGRGVLAVITEEGRERLRIASWTHLRALAQHFVSTVDSVQLAMFTRICEQIGAEGVPPPPGQRAQV